MPILVLFFLSGATALVYEVVWSKYLVLMFGSTVQAQTAVLATFMGGLALGNRLFGRWSGRLKKPLAAYGRIEIAIGLYGFLFGIIYQLGDRLFQSLGSQILDHKNLLFLLKAGVSLTLLIIPTVLMGGTLPLLATWLERQSSDAERRSAQFYATNSLGAVFGSAMAGFFLVRAFGMTATLQMTALFNVVIGLIALILARGPENLPPKAFDSGPKTTASPPPGMPIPANLCFFLVALTGGVSMGLEVLSSRALSLIFGASLQAFATVLISFILGIGIAGVIISSPRFKKLNWVLTTSVLLVSAAVLLGLYIWKIEQWVEIYRLARTGLARSEVGFHYHQLLNVFVAMLILGIPAGLIGAVLPLWIRAASTQNSGLGDRVGRLLTWNTFGAVIGVLLTGFVLMPQIGLRASFGLLGVLLGICAILLALRFEHRRILMAAGCVTALIILTTFTGEEGWRHVMSSGVFRARETKVTSKTLDLRKKHIRIKFYEDAADATVTVEQGDGIGAAPDLGLRINGKVEASTRADISTQFLLAHLPFFARPESKDVFLLGLGSGITAGAIIGHPIDHLAIVENCEPVLRASDFFRPWNRDVRRHPKTKIWNEDARTVLKLSPKNYDIIISQPSNPWMAGIGSIFSREFYELVAKRLKKGGVVAQWFHIYEMSDEIVALVVRTFGTVFPYSEIWDTGSGDLILIGAQEPWPATIESYQAVFQREEPRKDMVQIGVLNPQILLARQVASQRTAFAISDLDGPIQSDQYPLLEYDAPQAFYMDTTSSWLFQFDERTWQSELAGPVKQAALRNIDEGSLRGLFSTFSTMNNDLVSFFNRRFAYPENPLIWDVYVERHYMPCLFRPSEPQPRPAQPPPDSSEEVKSLFEAEALIHTAPGEARVAVESIKKVLEAQKNGASLKWSPGDYAALAAKNSLRRGDPETAFKLIELGLRLDPMCNQLRYIDRLVKRTQRPR